jgi:hypothetical protein
MAVVADMMIVEGVAVDTAEVVVAVATVVVSPTISRLDLCW